MGFEAGTISMRVCRLPGPLPADAVARFAAHAVPPLDLVRGDPVTGWVSGRYLTDREITDETAHLGGHMRLSLLTARRQIPAELLRAECRHGEIAFAQQLGFASLNRKLRRQVHDLVVENLLPTAPLRLDGITFVAVPAYQLLFVGATTPAKMDRFGAAWQTTMDQNLAPYSVDMLADVAHLDAEPLAFVDGLRAPVGTHGRAWLTWLWWTLETQGGRFVTDDGEFQMMVDGPLIFVGDGPGALVSGCTKGLPTLSAEATAALRTGKTLKRARLVIARNKGEEWRCTVDADRFSFSGLKLPEGEAMDPASIFEERVNNLLTFWWLIRQIMQRYLDTMSDARTRENTTLAVQQWAAERGGK